MGPYLANFHQSAHSHHHIRESQADRSLILQLSVSVHGVDGELNLSVSG